MLSRSIVGAVALPLAFLPSAAWATSGETTPAATGTASTPSNTVTEPVEEPVDEPEFESLPGTLSRNPATGAAGSSVTVSSVTKCVDADGVFGKKGAVGEGAQVVLFAWKDAVGDSDDITPAVDESVAAAKDGSWKITVTVPKTAKSGDTYLISGGCYFPDSDSDSEPFLVYDPEFFMVVDAPAAPVAEPVKKNPSFTG